MKYLTIKRMTKILIYLGLIGMGCLGLYMFSINAALVEQYESRDSKWVKGGFESYNKEETRKLVYFNFRLTEFDNVFSLPSPEWQSFAFDDFKTLVKKKSELQIEIPVFSTLNNKPVSVYQIKLGEKIFVDFEKKLNKRITEKWLSLSFSILCVVGLIHHYKKPWV
jgi:hypothetical protein